MRGGEWRRRFTLFQPDHIRFSRFQVAFLFQESDNNGIRVVPVNEPSWADCGRVSVVFWHEITNCDLACHAYFLSASSAAVCGS